MTQKSDTVHKFKIEVSKSLLEGGRKEVLTSLQKNFSKQGFRKGKVPLHLIEKEYEPIYINYEAEKRLLERNLSKYLKNSDLNYYPDSIKVNERDEKKDGSLVFDCEVEVEPKIDLPEFKKVEKPVDYKVKVEKKEFDDYKESVRRAYATWEDPKSTTKLSDESYLRIKIKLDDKIYPRSWFSKSEIENYPGMDEKSIGEFLKEKKLTKKIKVPKDTKDFDMPEVLGGEVMLVAELLDHKAQVLPKFDDELMRKLGFKDTKECEENFMKMMEVNKVRELKQKAEDKMLDDLVSKTKFDMPEIVLERAFRARKKEIEDYLTQKGVSFEDFLKSRNQEMVQFEENEKKLLEPLLKKKMVLDLLLDKYGKEPNEKDVETFMENASKGVKRQISPQEAAYAIMQEAFFNEYLHGKA